MSKKPVTSSKKTKVTAKKRAPSKTVSSRSKISKKALQKKGVKHHAKRIYHLTPKFIHGMVVGAFVGVVVVASLGIGQGASALSISTTKDCDQWSIINCGVTSTSNINSQYDKSSYVRNVYGYFGISSGDINNIGKTAVKGTVHNNGTVTVSGKVVATNVKTAARHKVSGGDGSKVTKSGSTFYVRHIKSAWSHTSGSAYVVFDKNGVFEYAILASCGNPIMGTPKPPAPQLACQSLTYKLLNKDERNYSFKAAATSKYTTITSYVFHFGDGSTKKVSTSAKTASTSHKFSKNDKLYSAYVVVNSDRKANETSSSCKVKLTTSKLPPALSCDSLEATLLSEKDRRYRFTVKASALRTAITSYSFNLGDGTLQTLKTSASSASVEHAFDDNKAHSVTVTVSSADFKNVTSPACTANIKGVDECKPGVPKDSKDCETVVTTLPNTGPGAILIVLALSVLGGAIFHKTHHHVRRRRHAAHR